MYSKFAPARLFSAAPADLHHRFPPFDRSLCEAAGEQTRATSSAGVLLLSLGVWAAVWATLASLSSWVR
jgi:hypothetical protein